MKYAIDAHYRDVIQAIISICNDEYEAWGNEGEFGDCEYEEVDDYYSGSFSDSKPLNSSANRYFRFEDIIFKIDKTQPAFGSTIVAEIDTSDAKWCLGESKDIEWIMEKICKVLNDKHYYGPFEYYTDHTDDFYALQEKYEIYISPNI